ncbi:hypothetical protein [uncultured Bacteroides sp.]|uniref:hypothetical protein n=1 Tax=uncultured Bacteroides sp. TaxID=162156 RepID=UPI002AA774E0|nr:hypothetical protein [uncultured Bacteroides sp.]
MSGNHLQVCHTNGGHFFGEWRSTIQEESKLSGVAPIGREIGGFMLTVSGLKKKKAFIKWIGKYHFYP